MRAFYKILDSEKQTFQWENNMQKINKTIKQ